jgi:nitrate reductase delta subunit
MSAALTALFADLFDYGQAGRAPAIAAAIAALLEERHAPAQAALERFVAATRAQEPYELEELFTRTFDLNPACAPFLSVHLWGDESFKRAILMTGLAETYARAGFERGSELPDHLAVVLRFAPRFAPEEWHDLATFCLPTPLVRMSAVLERLDHPYRHLVAALQEILRADFPMEKAPCSTASSSPPCHTSPCSFCSSVPSGDSAATSSAIPPCHPSSSKTVDWPGAPSLSTPRF